MVENIDAEQGFRIKGWFKPAVNENDSVAEEFVFHISYLQPNEPLTEEQIDMRYGTPSEGFSVQIFIIWYNNIWSKVHLKLFHFLKYSIFAIFSL